MLLAWVYENHIKIDDQLEVVEKIYANFDYPLQIEQFVRFMPPLDGYNPSHHSQAENRERMMGKWGEFLLQAEKWNK